MKFKNRELDFNNDDVYIMGILNITPDSFSDGGKYSTTDKALFRVEEMIKEGADIIDIGGESTRPFSEPVELQEELDRVIPIIESVGKNFNTIISVDTYKSKVAEEAIINGAEIINDISGFTFDSKMSNIAAKYNAAGVIMHIKGTPRNMQTAPKYENVVVEVYNFIDDKVKSLKKDGVDRIIIDVGFGFGKTLDDNYILLNNLDKFNKIGCPMLAGISRKSMIGKVIDIEPDLRDGASIALNSAAILKGAKIIRVHNVKDNYYAVQVLKKSLSLA